MPGCSDAAAQLSVSILQAIRQRFDVSLMAPWLVGRLDETEKDAAAAAFADPIATDAEWRSQSSVHEERKSRAATAEISSQRSGWRHSDATSEDAIARSSQATPWGKYRIPP